MKTIVIYEWAKYTTAIPTSALVGNTGVGIDFIGNDITFDDGTPIQLLIADDDDFSDAEIETGGGQTLLQDVTIGGTLYPAGSVVGNAFSMIDATGNEVCVVRVNGVNIGLTYRIGKDPTPGEVFTAADGRDGGAPNSTYGAPSPAPWSNFICFVTGTRIDTVNGPVAVEHLRRGDLIATHDNGAQPLRWIGSRTVLATGGVAPIRIGAGVLGNNRDLRLSPKHRILARGWQVELFSGHAEVLIEAEHLLDYENVIREVGGEVTYYQLLFDTHQLIVSEGALTESFFPTLDGMSCLPHPQLDEILTLFHKLKEIPDAYGPAARPAPRAHLAQLIAYALDGQPRNGGGQEQRLLH